MNTATSTQNEQLDPQTAYFAELCYLVNSRKLTMNQAFKKAQEGWQGADGRSIQGFAGNFQAWLDYAIGQGWVQDSLTVGEGIKETFSDPSLQQPATVPQPEQKSNRGFFIVGGILLAVTAGYLIWKNSQKKSEE